MLGSAVETPLRAKVRQRHSFNALTTLDDESQDADSTAMSIRRLPEDVVDKIKSSVVITSLNGVACGLLANSLDAGATKVNISVDYIRGNCTVEDNGFGILPDEFRDGGGLGKLHHTSRFPPRSGNHGKHGDFLASVANLSLLSVTSRHQRHVSHNSISIHHSQILSRHHPSPPEQRLLNFDHGTRVIVRDLFGSLPVRVKQRAAMAERSVLDKEWTKLIRDVVALLLAWPTGILVNLQDSVTRRELSFRPPQNTDAVSRTSRLLTQASLADTSEVDSWVPISASYGLVKVKGCIYANPVATRRSQFISLGIRPVYNEYGTDVLYEEINRAFSNSSFGIVDGDEYQPRNTPKLDGFNGKELRSRKGIERWPMFYLNITVSSWADTTNVDEKLNSGGKELAEILDLLKEMCYRFLKKHHFGPRKVRMSAYESVFSTTPTLSGRKAKGQTTSSSGSSRSGSVVRNSVPDSLLSRSNSPFDGWDRVKVGRATPQSVTAKAAAMRPNELETGCDEPLIGQGGKLLRKPFDELSPEPEESRETRPDSDADMIISTAGLPSFKRSIVEPETAAKKRRRIELEPEPRPSQWLQKVQKSWINPVFEPAERFVPQIYNEPALQNKRPETSNCCGRSHGSMPSDFASMSLDGRVSKEALSQAMVISQVDHKFILVKLPLENVEFGESHTGQGSTLMMLDQHAVDERCRLEELMEGYFTKDPTTGSVNANVEPLERPLVFEISTQESSLMEQYQGHFSAWGIIYRSNPREGKVVITDLPPSILERCRTEPRILIEMLRKEIWRAVDEVLPTKPRSSNSESDKPWVTNFHGCPKGILEMLHSRSCRSAIMFNDILTKEDCESLISRLAKCAFPFQCAHGRPSMAPLVDLGDGGRFGRWQEGTKERVRWTKWIAEA